MKDTRDGWIDGWIDTSVNININSRIEMYMYGEWKDKGRGKKSVCMFLCETDKERHKFLRAMSAKREEEIACKQER